MEQVHDRYENPIDQIVDIEGHPISENTRHRAQRRGEVQFRSNRRSAPFAINNALLAGQQEAILQNKYYCDAPHMLEDLHHSEYAFLASYVPATYAFITQEVDSLETAVLSPEWPQWQKAMQEELKNLAAINTWEFIHELPPGRKPLLYKWVLKKKIDIYNNLIFKARLTVKGCSQRPGIDFGDTFSPVAKMTAIRLLLSLGVSLDLEFSQFDVQNAFPNAELNEDIYMITPKEMEDADGPYMKLNRALYDLKQASRQWNILITETLLKIGFKQLTSESCIFNYNMDGKILILALYVDDMIIGADSSNSTQWLFSQLGSNFTVKQNALTRCLSINIRHDRKNRTLTLDKDDYTETLINLYSNLIEHIPVNAIFAPDLPKLSRAQCPTTEEDKQKMSQYPYRQIIGQFNYLTVCIRADISFWVSYLARFMDNPGHDHWLHLLNLLAYLRDFPFGSFTYCDPSHITFTINGQLEYMQPNRLYCFVDADFASSDLDNRRSVSGYLIFFNCGLISWKSVLQRRTSASSTEAEY